MIIEYDRSPGLTEEQRLMSLMASVQMALDELYKQNEELKQKIVSLEKRLANFNGQ